MSLLMSPYGHWAIIALALTAVIVRGFFVVLTENERGVVYVLGRYLTIYEPGLRPTVPFLFRVVKVDIHKPGKLRGEVLSWSGQRGMVLLDCKDRQARAETELTPGDPVIAVERDGHLVTVTPV